MSFFTHVEANQQLVQTLTVRGPLPPERTYGTPRQSNHMQHAWFDSNMGESHHGTTHDITSVRVPRRQIGHTGAELHTVLLKIVLFCTVLRAAFGEAHKIHAV